MSFFFLCLVIFLYIWTKNDMTIIKYRYVFNRKHRLNTMGEALVQIEAYQEGRKAYFGTHVYVKPAEWTGCEVTGRHDAAALNGMIGEQLVRLQEIEVAVWRQGVSPTLQHLKKNFYSKMPPLRLLSFASEVVEHSGRRESTRRNLLTTVRLLDRFRRVHVGDVDYALLSDFEDYLRGRGNCQNTIAKHIHNLRTVMGEAARRGLVSMERLPFSTYQVKTVCREHTTLTESELQRIEHTTVHGAVRDAFLFCCKTGLRYSDYVRLDERQFQQRGQSLWLELKMQKTGRVVQLPLTLLGRLLGDVGGHPAIGDNCNVNRKLREIVREAGIGKRVTFHVARHTFATRLLERGVPITTVQQLLGHASVRMTQRYAEVRTATVVGDLERAMSYGGGVEMW